jgi:hypothetical protein
MMKKYLLFSQEYFKLYRQDIIALLIVTLIGTLLATFPHILWLFKTGNPVWMASSDNMLYLAYTSDAYFNHPMHLSDPVLVDGGSTMYPWLQFIPGVLLIKLLGLNPIHINIIWRLWAGISISVLWYLVTRSYLKNIWIALTTSILLMIDVGVHSCSLFYKYFTVITKIAIHKPGNLLETVPLLLETNWRLITPGLSLAYLLLHIWLIHLALVKPTRKRIIFASISFGLLFYVYFYFWTSAAFALLLCLLVDYKNRKTYLTIGIIGTLIGLPQLIYNIYIKNHTLKDWLLRSDNFLPIPHFSELLLPSVAIILAFISLLWVIFRDRNLTHLWSLGTSALILTNHQIVTGLQIQNFHWGYCYGPVISLLTIVILTSLVSPLNWGKRTLIFSGIVISAIYLTTGFWLRYVEVTQSKESISYTASYYQYDHQRSSNSSIKLQPRAVIAGDNVFTEFAMVLENQRPLSGYTVNLSPSVSDNEWNERIALNDYLQGFSRPDFIAKRQTDLRTTKWGPWVRNPKLGVEVLHNQISYFDEISINPVKALKRFQVKYVALLKGKEQPKYLNNGWKLLQNGSYWQIWQNQL